jgi:nucleoside permease NupC
MGAALVRLLAAFVLVAVGTAILRKIMAPSPPAVRRVDDGSVNAEAQHGRRRDDV